MPNGPRQNHMFISGFLLMFAIHGNQVGIGIAGVQRFIYERVQQDAWIAVIIAGLVTNMVGWIMLKTLQRFKDKNLYDIHQDVYGVWLAKGLNLFYVVFMMGSALTVLRGYIEIIQSWMFPEVPSWILNGSLLCLVIYGITGGVRVIVGVSFFSVILTLWQILLLYFPLQYADFNLLQPVFHHDLSALLQGAKKMSFTLIGFEALWFLYPYVKEKKSLPRYVQGGLFLTTGLYLVVMLVTLLYFEGSQLQKLIWPTLMMLKIVEFPFLERFELVSIALWMLIMLDNLLLTMWVAMKGINHVSRLKEKYAILLVVLLMFLASSFLETRQSINKITDIFGWVGFYVVMVYPFVLYVIALLRGKGAART